LYACAMYDAEENLEKAPPNKVLLGVQTKGDLRYDCLWQFGAASKAAAIAALPCDLTKFECRLVASDGVLDAAFRPYAGTTAGSGLPRDLLDTLAPEGADAPSLRPPGIGPPLVAVDGVPPLGPLRQSAPSGKGQTP
jgi:hypothetical protein